jgi:hypothetical protein
MDEHICRFNTDADNASQQPNHGMWPGLSLLLQSFLTRLLDRPDLADDEAQPRQCRAAARPIHLAAAACPPGCVPL